MIGFQIGNLMGHRFQATSDEHGLYCYLSDLHGLPQSYLSTESSSDTTLYHQDALAYMASHGHSTNLTLVIIFFL